MVIRARREPLLESRQTAFPHQVAAIEAIRNLTYAAIFHEQGLGKTKIALDLAVSWLAAGTVDSVMIVTKRGLVENWKREVQFHSFMTPTVLDQDKKKNFLAFNSPARLYLTHYEVCKSELRRLRLFQKTRRIGVILDEAHKIKNPETGVTEALLELAGGFVRRVIMTGTPVANRPYDLWAQIKFLDNGVALGVNYSAFRSSFDLSKDLGQNAARRGEFESELAAVNAKISAFSVRETKKSSGLKLPGKQITSVPVLLEERQAELYESLRSELRASVERDGLVREEKVDEILKRLLRLVQVASNPRLVDHAYDNEPGKVSNLQSLVEAVVDVDEKVIVWTSFVENADWLAAELRRISGVAKIHGRIAMEERDMAIRTFLEDRNTRVLVATPGAAKEGLTLTVANHAVFYDRSFSLDDYLQAQDRIHRISQTKECYITNLIAVGTVDEWVDELLAAKHLAAGLAQGDITLEEYRGRATYAFSQILDDVLGRSGTGTLVRGQ